jgi:hypothetical protein
MPQTEIIVSPISPLAKQYLWKWNLAQVYSNSITKLPAASIEANIAHTIRIGVTTV